MASGSQNMTTYNARTVTGSNSAASPAGALLLSGAGEQLNYLENRSQRLYLDKYQIICNYATSQLKEVA